MMARDSGTHEVRSDQRSTEPTMLVAFTTSGDLNGLIPAQNGGKRLSVHIRRAVTDTTDEVES